MTNTVKIRPITDNCVKLAKQFEGFYSKVYVCPAGYRTIGYGHVVKPNENFTEISEDEAIELLRQDLLVAQYWVCRLINVPLANSQYDALVDFTFNVGAGNLRVSTLRQKLNRMEYSDAADQFLRWVYAGRPLRKLPGLVRRREAERSLFLYGGNYEI